MIIQHTLNRRGTEYTYFFCRNRQDGTCDAPSINVALVEDAVEAHYATVRFNAEFTTEVRAHVTTVINERDAAERLLHKQLTTELQTLDTREDNLIELAADASAPQLKIKAKLQEIARDRQRLSQRLTTTAENLSDSAKLIDMALELLKTPNSSTADATTNSAGCSTKPPAALSTSTTTRSPTTVSTNHSTDSTRSSTPAKPTTPRQTAGPQKRKTPPLHMEAMASASYYTALI